MKNHVGKNIVTLRKECGMSQEQLAGHIHVTRQAVSNWETGRSQPDLDMLEALAEAFDTDIHVVIYGQQPDKEDADIHEADRKRHLRMAVIMGLISLIGSVLSIQILGVLSELRARTYHAVPYMLFRLFVIPVICAGFGIMLMHVLGLFCKVRISRLELKKKVLVSGVALSIAYVVITICTWEIFPPYIALPGWLTWLPYYMYNSICSYVLFFIIGILIYLGTEP